MSMVKLPKLELPHPLTLFPLRLSGAAAVLPGLLFADIDPVPV